MVAKVSRSVLLVSVLALLGYTLGCKQLQKINIPCNVAGIVLNDAGQPQGYITVQLIDPESGMVAQQMTTEDSGNFMFSKIDPGTYEIKVLGMGQVELPTEKQVLEAQPGKTYDLKVIVKKLDKDAPSS
jgi:hypothetical protein